MKPQQKPQRFTDTKRRHLRADADVLRRSNARTMQRKAKRSARTATLHFDLTDPDGKHELALALAGGHLASFVWDLMQEIRNACKHHHGFDRENPTMEDARTWVATELIERGLTRVVEG